VQQLKKVTFLDFEKKRLKKLSFRDHEINSAQVSEQLLSGTSAHYN